MKTKHLFFAAALAASFTACTSDELVEVQQQGVATVERPTVENVQLNFIGEGAESRLTFGANGYAWEATDTIGALLMDTPNGGTSTTPWISKYTLQNFVNTSYPFTYSTENGTWSCAGKMLEGNYFFAYPWSSYDGERAMKHSLINQTQKGIKSNVVAEALAANQLFIGYSQIKKGTAFDVLTDVEMTSVLGALQLRIKNEGTKTYHINKIVLSGGSVASEVTFNPTNAEYAGEEVDGVASVYTFHYKGEGNLKWFNYANYVGDKEAEDVYGIDEDNAAYYNRANALRAVVNPVADARNVAYLNVEGTESERALAKGQTAYALIMVNPLTEVTDVELKVYTDEGVIDFGALSTLDNLTSEPIEAVLPGISNTVVESFEDAQVTAPEEDIFSIYTEEDLLQYIKWYKNSTTGTVATAELCADVELNKEMFDLMKAYGKVTWNVVSKGYETTAIAPYKLILAADIPANALEYAKLNIGEKEVVSTTYPCPVVEVEGTIDFTKNLTVNALTIAEGGVMNIKVDVDGTKVALPVITNKGTLNIAAVQVIGAGNITNEKEGTINVAQGADVKGAADTGTSPNVVNHSLTNKGILNNAGYIEYVKNIENENEDAAINLSANAVLKSATNGATINAAAGSSISGSNSGLIACADNTVKINVSNAASGRVALEVTGAIAKDAYKDLQYNTLKINGQTVFADIQTGVNHIITTDGSELKLAEAAATYTLSLKSLEINGATKITTVLTGTKTNKVSAEKIVVKKDAVLTNDGDFEMTTTTGWENKGKVVNNQTAKLNVNYFDGTTTKVPNKDKIGTWLYNDPIVWTAAYNAGTAVGHVVEFSGSEAYGLYSSITKAQGEGSDKNSDGLDTNDFVKELNIKAELDMKGEANVNSAGTQLYNYNHIAALAKKVTLEEGGSIINLENSHAVDMEELVVNADASISGTSKMPILKTDKLTVAENTTLTILGGYIEIDVTAQLNMGCEKLDLKGGVVGQIIAKDAEGTYLYWNATEGEWNTGVQVNIAAATVNDLDGLMDALNDRNVTEVTLSSQIEINGNVVLNAAGKTVKRTEAEQSGALFNVTSGSLTIKGGNFIADIEHASVETNPTATGLSVAVVHVRNGATLNIEDGYFYAGADNMEKPAGVPVIEAWAGAVVNISGGEFKTELPCSAGNGKYTWMVLNRCENVTSGIFNVTGGKFWKYNPAAALTDAGGNAENATIANGYHADELSTETYNVKIQYVNSWGDIWFTVCKDEH